MNKLDISVLLVEDDKVSKILYSKFLDRIVNKVFHADNGIEGINIFKEHKPDIVLSDIIMPKMDGLEMAKKIKEIDDSIKIILISGYQDTDFFIKSIELGVSGYLLKPIEQDKLVKIIHDIGTNILLNKKIKETEKKFKDLAELLPEIIFEADLKGRFTFINKKAHKILGYTDKEIEKGITLHKVILSDLESMKSMEQLLKNMDGEVLDKEIEIHLRTKTGETFPALMYASPIIDSQQTVGIRGVVVNISKQKQIEYELQRLNLDLESKVQDRTLLLTSEIEERKLVELALIENQERHLALSNATFETILMVENQICLESNQAAKEMFAYSNDEFLGKNVFDLISKNYHKVFRKVFLEDMDTALEVIALTKENKKFNAEIQWKKYKYKGKEVYVIAINNISMRKYAEKLLKQRMQFIELINKTSSEFIRLDTIKIDQGINTALQEVCRFTKADRAFVYLWNIESNTFELSYEYHERGVSPRTETIPQISTYALNPAYNILKKGDSILYNKNDISKLFKGKDITQKMSGFDFESSLKFPMLNRNSLIGFYGFDSNEKEFEWNKEKVNAYEITGQIIANAIQRKKYDEELIKAKEKAEESDKSKSTFLANISHEIQTPIKAIISFSNMIQSPELSPNSKDEFLNIININSQALLSLTNDILEFTKIQSNVIKLFNIKFDINLFLDEMYMLFNSLKLKRGKEDIELKTIIPEPRLQYIVFSDPSRLKQIFINLIGNSFKFTSNGFVEYGYEIVKNNSIRFFVRDTGIGISKKYQKLIFDRFIQEPKPLSIKKEGTGLGLAITHSLVNLLGGKIWVESELGKGSSFYFEIPGIVFQDTEEHKQFIWDNKQILVIDDVIQDYIQLEEILNDKAKILYVGNSKQAIEICRSNNLINTVLLSCSLVVREKEYIFDSLKDIIPSLNIICMADKDTSVEELERKCKKYDEIINKPIDTDILLKTLDKYLGNND